MKRARKYIVYVCVATAVISVCAYVGGRWMMPRWLFRRLLANHLPPSVRAICVDSSFGLNQHQYVLRFTMKEGDLADLLGARSFRRMAHARYRPDSGIVEYGDSPRFLDSFALYPPRDGENPPHWFKLDMDDRSEVYVADEEDKHEFYRVGILFYNSNTRDAYFIEYEQGGTTEPHVEMAFRFLRAWNWMVHGAH